MSTTTVPISVKQVINDNTSDGRTVMVNTQIYECFEI